LTEVASGVERDEASDEPSQYSDALTLSRVVRLVLDAFALAAGVAAITLGLALSQGAASLAKGPISGLEPDVVAITGTAPSYSGVESGFPSHSLTSDDVAALGNVSSIPTEEAEAATVGVRANVQSLVRTASTDVIGSTPSFAFVRGYSLSAGRFIDQQDMQLASPVAVLGQTVVNTLFPGSDPIGQDVTISGHTFQVIGTLRPLGFSGTFDQDNLVVLPITEAWTSVFSGQGSPIDQVLIRTASPANAAAAARAATATLLRTHSITDPTEADFTVVDHQQLAAADRQTALGVKRALEVAGAVLLLAGAIHLGLVSRDGSIAGDETLDRREDGLAQLVRVLFIGVVAAFLGVAFAAVAEHSLPRLAASLPASHLTVVGATTGWVLGVAAAACSLLPASFGLPRGSHRRPPGHAGLRSHRSSHR
jgi:putative ABC transport system permease protein